VSIGRDPHCDIVLDSPSVSWRHAAISTTDGHYWIQDLGSTNGTWVNERRVEAAPLTMRDIIRAGDVTLPWTGILAWTQPEGEPGLVLECTSLGVHAPSGRALLRDVTFSAQGGQLVAIIGPSGAGKSTLVRSVVGQTNVVHGRVACNGADMGRSPEIVWSWVGYVPQDDIVHRELVLRDALSYSAQLRVPVDLGFSDSAKRVLRAADLCQLAPHLDKRIDALSGGERKRASVAVELLTQPPVLVFDEPTSGLDPALERSFMELCRRLADAGHLVLLTTHVTRSLGLCDRVLVLFQGEMVFFGPPRHLTAFFRVDEPAELYRKLGDGTDWATRFRQTPVFVKYVARPVSQNTPVPLPPSGKLGSGLRQWAVLLRRYLSVLQGDARNLAFLGLQAPIIAAVVALVFPEDTFRPSGLRHSAALLFVMVVAALWFGTSNSAREIVKERSIYTRERTIGLDTGAYVASKALPLVALGFLQSLVLVLVVGVKTDWFGDAGSEAVLRIWLVLNVAAACGVGLGLCLSALATSPDQAISLTPVVLLPQLVFSGIFPAVEEGSAFTKLCTRLAAANWAFGALGHVLDLNGKAAECPAAVALKRRCFDHGVLESLFMLLVMFGMVSVLAWLALLLRRPQH
jgi:ABC-type multidrug transport system ATPase subunit